MFASSGVPCSPLTGLPDAGALLFHGESGLLRKAHMGCIRPFSSGALLPRSSAFEDHGLEFDALCCTVPLKKRLLA